MNCRRHPYADELGLRFLVEVQPRRILICDLLEAPIAVLEAPFGRQHLAELHLSQFRHYVVIAHEEMLPRALEYRGDRQWDLKILGLPWRAP